MLRRLKQKYNSISAPRLTVRPHMPWYVRWAVALPVVVISVWLLLWAYDSGMELAGFNRGKTAQEITLLRDQIAALKTENARLSAQAAAFERQAQIDRAANSETEKQLKSLNEENEHIQEDLAYLQNLAVSGKHMEDLSIHRLKVEHDALPGEYRYHLLLVQDAQPDTHPFHGNLQLLVSAEQDGKKTTYVFPQTEDAKDAAYQLNFKYYQRVENSFRLPADASVDSIQVRIYERGSAEPKIKQDANLT